MSIGSDGYEPTRQPRLGRWLVWLCYLLIGAALLSLISMSFGIYGLFSLAHDAAVARKFILQDFLPPILEWIMVGLAGFFLLYWRRSAGFKTALTLIWLAPVLAIIHSTWRYGFQHDAQMVVGQFLLRILHDGVFHAAGCTAFLLGAPRLRAAYGIATKTDLAADLRRVTGLQPSGIGIFSLFLCLPSLILLPPVDHLFGEKLLQWGDLALSRPLVNLALATPFVVVVIMLAKYRRWRQVQIAITLLWLTILIGLANELVPNAAGKVSVLRHVGLVLRSFGFDLITAYAWTAYLLTAPRVQAMYPRPVEEVDVEAF